MKKKIGLITIQNANYGSRLQMFALYTIINSIEGCECIVIDYKYPTEYHKKNALGNESKVSNKIYSLPVFFRKCKSCYRYFVVFLLKKIYRIDLKKEIEDFTNVYNKTELYDRESIIKNPPKFDIYVTGSDQVWNPRYYHKDYSFLLNFTKEDDIRIAYSSSFGSKEMLSQYAADYTKYLKRYLKVSVRERSGVDLYKKLTGKDAIFCLDPTMLLTKEMWYEYSLKNQKLKEEKYILCYIQSYAFNPYPYIDKLIKRVRKITGYSVKIITQNIYEKVKGYDVQYNVSSQEFIDLYYNASFVIACSFHAIVFSIIMQKPFFAVMNAKTNDDRQINLITEFDLQNRAFYIGDKLPNKEQISLDYTDVNIKLEKLRFNSIQYLKNVLTCQGI